MKHCLLITSYYDAQAKCKCKRWEMICTGARTKAEIRKEFEKHLKHERNYRRRKL